MEDKKILFTLQVFDEKDDSIYLVTDKVDHGAPTGFQTAGVTKLPSDGVATTFHCPYKRISATDGVWDSGLYPLSPCYEGMDEKIVDARVKGLMKNIVEPYRKAVGKTDALDEHNHEFFDKHNWSVEEGKVFKTKNPIDRVALYFALLNREVVPKEKKGDTSFSDAGYMIVDVNEKVKKRDADASMQFEAIGIFEELYKTDKQKLNKILYYLGKNMAADTKVEAYRGMFRDYLGASATNVEVFNKLVSESNSEAGLARLDIYYYLKNRDTRNPKVTKHSSGVLFYEDTEIGADLKTAAENIAKNPGLSKIKKEILFAEVEE